ncbi:unnamed protein product [Rotaria sordida]|uniref:Nuclear receptor domain-containing protein n=1 Tax=Rotaria sordida TaxID=392033 RepID=A0A814VFW0_9BILA|nr:unnamed protein product [Rotaria sordida]
MNRKRQSTIVLRECKICEAPAQYSYYGVIACSPCKIFFKRNAERGQKVLKCNSDGHCEINSNNRYHCSYCRLMKCFTNGMQTEMLRSSLPKRKKKSEKEKMMTNPVETTSTALVRLNQLEQFPTLNLLRSDQSTLDVDQWNLISNLSRCYDEHSGLSIGQTYMHEQNKLPHKLRYKCASVSELYQMMFNDAQLLYKNNRDFRCLSADDRSILLHSTLSHTTLSNLTLRSNDIGANGAQYLAEALQNTTTLTMLNLESSNIDSVAAQYLAQGLQNNTTLTELNLHYNKFGDEGLEYLTRAFQNNTVRQVFFSSTVIS